MQKEFNVINIRLFLDEKFKNNLKVLLRAIFKKESVCYYYGKLELADQYHIVDVVALEIAEVIYNEFKDWEDLYKELNKHIEVVRHYE